MPHMSLSPFLPTLQFFFNYISNSHFFHLTPEFLDLLSYGFSTHVQCDLVVENIDLEPDGFAFIHRLLQLLAVIPGKLSASVSSSVRLK